jgi:hypothetical protein
MVRPMHERRMGSRKQQNERADEVPGKPAAAGPQVRSRISGGMGEAFQLAVLMSRHQKKGQEKAQARK